MADFIVRVVLHNVRDKLHGSYKDLHAAMAEAGFLRTITDLDNVTWELPPAEYRFVGEVLVGEVCTKAEAIADQIDIDNGVFVVQVAASNGYAWTGLK